MSRLTMQEVIEHCERTVKGYEWTRTEQERENIKRYWEHKQTAEWLKELQHYKDLEEQGGLIEVIRCKDCIRHSDEYEVGADGISWCDEHERLTDDDDYCSYAVAKLAEMEGAE